MEIVCEGYKKSMRKDSDNAKLLEPGELPSKRKVLVVEDNELNREIAKMIRRYEEERDKGVLILFSFTNAER